jgi:tRNA uridine 5-carbamoylmethylation protein Kti12
MKNTLYIIRGLPGSGKSTEAQRLLNIKLLKKQLKGNQSVKKESTKNLNYLL